jgi:hypothetical protein
MLPSELVLVVMIQLFMFVVLLVIVIARTQGVTKLRDRLDRLERDRAAIAEIQRDLAYVSDRTANLVSLRQRLEQLERRTSGASITPSIFSSVATASTLSSPRADKTALLEPNQAATAWDSAAAVSAQIEAELRRGRESVTTQLFGGSSPTPAPAAPLDLPLAPPPAPPAAPTAFPGIDAAMLNLLQAGKKLEAIKQYREETGASYADSKAAIEAVIAHLHQNGLLDRP